ncbi:DUF481 domain-containing protein [Chitinimonas koreensis]|uniref:DUF481 domain-containing protein n=1 Tax=Chitinimonas koreensis TaxID=356302 RepID=UPI0003F9ADFC|nr:DUF481 domain-containing protein [Chitinimonas koreensis]QNM95234.1 DUF481 domain-containing protein [Chitinimonas koreensis]
MPVPIRTCLPVLLLSATLAAHAGWEGEAEASADFSRGNSRSDAWRVDLDVAKRTDHDRSSMLIEARRERAASDEGAVELVNERYLVSPKYERWRDGDDRYYGFVDPELKYNRFSYLKHRNSLIVGAGLRDAVFERGKLTLEVGPGYRRTVHSDDTRSNAPLLVVRNRFDYPIGDSIDFFQTLQLEYSRHEDLAELGVGLKSKLSEHFSVKFRVDWTYSEPVDSLTRRLDTESRFSVAYEF